MCDLYVQEMTINRKIAEESETQEHQIIAFAMFIPTIMSLILEVKLKNIIDGRIHFKF